MTNETDEFVVDQVQWAYQQSREIRDDHSSPEPVRTHIQSAMVECKRCCFRWRAKDGRGAGHLDAVLGGTRISCPNCNAEGLVRVG